MSRIGDVSFFFLSEELRHHADFQIPLACEAWLLGLHICDRLNNKSYSVLIHSVSYLRFSGGYIPSPVFRAGGGGGLRKITGYMYSTIRG